MDTTFEEVKTNRIFPLQLWLSTIVIAPILLFGGTLIFDPSYFNNPDNYPMFFLFVGFGLIYSLPTFLVCFLSFELLTHKFDSSFLIKTLVAAITICGVFVTFLIIGGSEATTYSLFYSASIIISSLIFKVAKL